jgi:pimeloyl-ACP methyl ester carboxylesterase
VEDGATRQRHWAIRLARGVLAGAVLAIGFPGPAAGAPDGGPEPLEHKLGAPDLRRCQNIPQARCGRIRVPADPNGAGLGTTKIGFELYPRRDPSSPLAGTIVAVEGGPGYSTTGSRDYYRDLFDPLLDRRQLLLVDLRGTGRSDPILCQPLQSYRGNYVNAVGRCGRQLGERSDVYGTAFAARDLVEVLDHLGIDRIDLYGDSYGTFFSQTFAVRHPERLRSLILDSAYYVGGTDPFYVDTNRAIRDAFRNACLRSPACAERGGDPMRRIARLARMLRRDPVAGRAPDADGKVASVEVDVGGLIYLVTAAASSPAIYRELDAAARAALRSNPYVLPLLRLARETFYEGGAGAVRWYSEGLYVAVACNDYPQPYDMLSPVRRRPTQYRRVLRGLRQERRHLFAPFTIREWVTAPVEYFDSCIKWPRPSEWVQPVPLGAEYPETPTLVLAGDLDSLTSPEGARVTASAFPNSTYVEVANMTHVTALVDFDRCSSLIVRRFVRTLDPGDTSCAGEYNEIRMVERFARRSAGLDWGGPKRRTARIAAATAADVIARWNTMVGYRGVGLRGGTFKTRGGTFTSKRPVVRWRLSDVRWVEDVRVSGSMRWVRDTGEVRATLTVRGRGAVPGRLNLRWDDWQPTAAATARGTLGGERVRFSFPAG